MLWDCLQAFTLQPLYGKDAAEMVPSLLSNLSDVAVALQGAAGELRSGNEAILQSLTGESACSPAASVHLITDEAFLGFPWQLSILTRISPW